MKTKLGLLLCLTIIFAIALQRRVTCPIDDSGAYFTGKTMVDNGALLRQYKCLLRGHIFWVRI